jgi:hypothetical protein
MALSRGMALTVVKVIDTDPECRWRINSPLSAILPASLGIAGSVRNLGFILSDVVTQRSLSVKPTTAEEELICYGIRDAAIEALQKAVKASKGGDLLNAITKVTYINRDHPAVHAAMSITIAGKDTYVFDWHATLDTKNPMLYPSAAAFDSSTGFVTFSEFTGFA